MATTHRVTASASNPPRTRGRTTELRIDDTAPAALEFRAGLLLVGRLICELAERSGAETVTATDREVQALLRVAKDLPGWPTHGQRPLKLAPIGPAARGRR
jgi:hypothetical protein